MVPDADEPRWLGRAGPDAQQQVVAPGLQLGRPQDLDLEVVTLSDLCRLLGQGVGGELVGRRVLPLTRAVGSLAVFLCGHHLALASAAKADERHLVDLAPLGSGPGLPRAALERAHHAALDHRLEAVHAQGLAAKDGHALVAPSPGGAHELVMGGAQTLPVKVVHGAKPV